MSSSGQPRWTVAVPPSVQTSASTGRAPSAVPAPPAPPEDDMALHPPAGLDGRGGELVRDPQVGALVAGLVDPPHGDAAARAQHGEEPAAVGLYHQPGRGHGPCADIAAGPMPAVQARAWSPPTVTRSRW